MVYFIQSGGPDGPIKIGTAEHVPARLAALQTGHPEELRVIGVLDGSHEQERVLHFRFRQYRIRGEWFAVCSEILGFIKRATRAERQVRRVPVLDALLVLRGAV